MKKIIILVFISMIKLYATASLSNIFQDKMILQSDKPLKIWGNGNVAEKVVLMIEDQEDSTFVDDNGNWEIIIEPLNISRTPILFKLKSEGDTKYLTDVLVGDVWFCSGQSNMALTVNYTENAEEEIENSENENIRLFTVPQSYNLDINDNQNTFGSWQLCIPENVRNFSATAYYYGKELNQKLDIPIGLINSSYGSSMIESWTSIEGNLQVEGGVQYIEDVYNNLYPDLGEENYPSALFNAMVYPFSNFSIKGFIWYQGERNTRTDEACFKYRYQLPALIYDWRTIWNDQELPFYYVQLPNFNIDYNWALMRESMEVAEVIPNTGMAVTIDIGESDNIHPANKQDVGKRLSLLSLNRTYNQNLIDEGLKYFKYHIDGDRITLEFENVNEGINYIGDFITGFEISEDFKNFYEAEAHIRGNSIVLSKEFISNPNAVRYGWSSDPKCNVYNSANLPLRPFKTYNTADANSHYLPSCIELKQNYPNPFNPTTIISFYNEVPERLSLSVYTSNGEKIVTLIEGNLDSGIHKVKFDGNELPSGVYFYSIQNQSKQITKRMTLIK